MTYNFLFDKQDNRFFYGIPLNNSLNSEKITTNSLSTVPSTTSYSDRSRQGSRLPSDSNFIGFLKEWAIICKALEDGKQVLSFRKGGIMEYRNGFELKYKDFFLFPTFEHQSKESIRKEYHEELNELEKLHQINNNDNNTANISTNVTNITSFVEITYFNTIDNINTLDKLDKFHIWNNDYLHNRFNYNPKKPLYLMLLRSYRLNDAFQIINKPEWAGCKSWIQIDSNDLLKLNNTYFPKNLFHKTFEYLKSISKPCISDNIFNEISEEVRSIIK